MQNLLENYLEAAEGAGQVLAHAKLLMKLARLYEKIAPAHLSQTSCVANYKSGVMVIHAANSALAAKLRQMAPTLAAEFSKQGVQCNELKVKVQVREVLKKSIGCKKKPLSARTGKELAGLSNSLPDSPLRSALEHLLSRAAIKQ
jgi:hypothetical protein